MSVFQQTCVTAYEYASSSLATSTQTCVSPDRWFLSFGFVVAGVFLIAFAIYKLLK